MFGKYKDYSLVTSFILSSQGLSFLLAVNSGTGFSLALTVSEDEAPHPCCIKVSFHVGLQYKHQASITNAFYAFSPQNTHSNVRKYFVSK